MKTYRQWMDEYGVDHKNPTNQAIHKVCVPFIMFSIIGIFWTIPRIEVSSVLINWAFVFMAPALLFYWSLKNTPMFLMIVLQLFLMSLICSVIFPTGMLLQISLFVFILAWIAQFIGHKIEGRKPSFLQDISFLLIGPLWVNRFILKKIGWEE
jgi:uncharacterized membrane protein YGL010W